MVLRRSYWTWLAAALLAGILLLLPALLTPGKGLAAAEPESARTLQTVGQSTLDIAPDKAIVTLGVSTQADTAGESYSKASDVMNRITGSLTLLGVSPLDVQTSQLSLHEERPWNQKTQEPGDPIYRTTATLRVATTNLKLVGKLVDAALEAGANSLQGIQFTADETEQRKNEAIDKAVDDAKAKAERVSARLGAEVGRALKVTVSVGQSGQAPPPIMYELAAKRSGSPGSSAAAMPVMPGTVPLQAAVSVEFELK